MRGGAVVVRGMISWDIGEHLSGNTSVAVRMRGLAHFS